MIVNILCPIQNGTNISDDEQCEGIRPLLYAGSRSGTVEWMTRRNTFLIIIAVTLLCVGVWLVFSSYKSCASLSESQCKKDGRCLSVLVPNRCDDPPCTPDAVFKECKDKAD